jgi:CHAT domain-containing protein/tetratricopeptide (TPR) repeat protein
MGVWRIASGLARIALVIGVVLTHCLPVTYSPAVAAPSTEAKLSELSARVIALYSAGKFAEALPLAEQYSAMAQTQYGVNSTANAVAKSWHALLLKATNRLQEAEVLMREAVAITEKTLGPDHPNFAIALNNLAFTSKELQHFDQAESLYRRALGIIEKNGGTETPLFANTLNELGEIVRAQQRPFEAETYYRRALAINEKQHGPDHPAVAANLNNLALTLKDTDRTAEAEPLYRRALSINERNFGPNDFRVVLNLSNLAVALEAMNRAGRLARILQLQGRLSEAAALCLSGKKILSGLTASSQQGAVVKSILAANRYEVKNCQRILFQAGSADQSVFHEAFEGAEWVLANTAGDALSSMAARFAKGGAKLATLVRVQQDLIHSRDTAYRTLDLATGRADASAAENARLTLSEIEIRLKANDAALARDFPEYIDFVNPKPTSIDEIKALLGQNQAFVLFLDLPRYGKLPDETLVFAVTRKEARWASIPFGTEALREHVTALRCGLDASQWQDGKPSRENCKRLLATEASEYDTPPFAADLAYALYRDLFGPIEGMIENHDLLIVPSGPLMQLPFEVLVTERPDEKLGHFEAYKTASWLGQQKAITILPSAGSLKALNMAKSSRASLPFLGFGNPLLTGGNPSSGSAQMARDKQDCGKAAPPGKSRIALLWDKAGALFFRGGAVNVDELRTLAPLPETGDELCAVAKALGAADPDAAVFLGERATVARVKALSKSGELAKAKVVHFATHGALARETAEFAKNKADHAGFEPALLLTPPAADKVSEEDNGLLTASEVAQLNLDADWVIMSACNTAAGQSDNAEALSGLARAFFYAGARALLVSHWYVDSEAAVAITTGAVNAMKAEPKIGRAEALRRSISALIARGGRFAHPSVWAPFVLVGNGGG